MVTSSLTALPTTSTTLTSNIHPGRGRLVGFRSVDNALLDVASEAVECFLHIDVTLRRHLKKWDAQLIGKLLASLRRDDALVFPITFVAN